MVLMHVMQLSSLDLNLLTTLDALLSTGSVNRAAQRLGRTQSAVSHALQRLRAAFADPLLVRVGQGMRLTPRAEELREPLADVLRRVGGLFVAERFDPSVSDRQFTLMAPDLVLELLLPALLSRVAAEAPGVRIRAAPWVAPDVMAPETARSLDLVLTCVGDAYPGFHRQRLYTDTDVLAVRGGREGKSALSTLEGFRAAGHVAVTGQGGTEDMIDAWLRPLGVRRDIVVTVPNYILALRMAARTDLVAFAPSRLVEAYVPIFGLEALPPPLDPGVDEQYLFYPVTAQNDPGSRWLRTTLLDLTRGLPA